MLPIFKKRQKFLALFKQAEEEVCYIWQRFVLQPKEMDQWTWFEKEPYYQEYYKDDFDLVTTGQSSCSGESEAESHNESIPHEMFFWKRRKNILVSSSKVSTFVNAFSVCKFCNNPFQIEEENDKAVGLIYLLKLVSQNEKYLKSTIKSSVNMSNKNGQFFEINYLCLFMNTARQKSGLCYNNNDTLCQSTY